MKQVIGMNIYRLSLLMMLVMSIFSLDIAKIIFPNDTPLFAGIGAFFAVVLPTLALVIILRCTAIYLQATVKWWDFLIFIIVAILSDAFYVHSTPFGGVFDAILPISIVILLIITFRKSKTGIN